MPCLAKCLGICRDLRNPVLFTAVLRGGSERQSWDPSVQISLDSWSVCFPWSLQSGETPAYPAWLLPLCWALPSCRWLFGVLSLEVSVVGGDELGVTKEGGVDAGVQAWPSLPSHRLPSTRPLPGVFFPVSFPAINSQVTPGLSMARNGRKQALAQRLGAAFSSPPGVDRPRFPSYSPSADRHVEACPCWCSPLPSPPLPCPGSFLSRPLHCPLLLAVISDLFGTPPSLHFHSFLSSSILGDLGAHLDKQ